MTKKNSKFRHFFCVDSSTSILNFSFFQGDQRARRGWIKNLRQEKYELYVLESFELIKQVFIVNNATQWQLQQKGRRKSFKNKISRPGRSSSMLKSVNLCRWEAEQFPFAPFYHFTISPRTAIHSSQPSQVKWEGKVCVLKSAVDVARNLCVKMFAYKSRKTTEIYQLFVFSHHRRHLRTLNSKFFVEFSSREFHVFNNSSSCVSSVWRRWWECWLNTGTTAFWGSEKISDLSWVNVWILIAASGIVVAEFSLNNNSGISETFSHVYFQWYERQKI